MGRTSWPPSFKWSLEIQLPCWIHLGALACTRLAPHSVLHITRRVVPFPAIAKWLAMPDLLL